MSVARLSSDNEVLALQAAGVSRKRIFIPLFILGFIFSLMSFFINDYLLPHGFIEYKRHYSKMLHSSPQLALEPFAVNEYENINIITGDIQDNVIYDIVIFDKTEQNKLRIISAQKGIIEKSKEQEDVIALILDNVFSLLINPMKENSFEYSYSETMIYNILLKIFDVKPNPGPTEMSIFDIWLVIQEKEKGFQEKLRMQRIKVHEMRYTMAMEIRMLKESPIFSAQSINQKRSNLESLYDNYIQEKTKKIFDRSLQKYLLEFHKKFAFPFACIFFIIFAFPIGLMARRSGRIVGFGIGVIVSFLYWGLLLVGHEIGYRHEYPPFIAMWLPNLVVLFFGLFFLILRMRK